MFVCEAMPSRKAQKTPVAEQSTIDEPTFGGITVHAWAQRICSNALSAGYHCSYKTVNVFTEFSGSTCPESAIESVVSFMPKDEKPQLNFRTMADLKPGCRSVAMKTRIGLRFSDCFL